MFTGSVGIWRIDTKCPWLQVKANGGDSSLPGKGELQSKIY